MNRLVLPLLLASDSLDKAHTETLDRLRMQKGVFLMSMRGPQHWQDLYDFEPYDWGPYSIALSADIKTLCNEGLLHANVELGRRYKSYQTSSRGERFTIKATEAEKQFAEQIRHFVTSRPFSRLLLDLYGVYPQYAANSRIVFPIC